MARLALDKTGAAVAFDPPSWHSSPNLLLVETRSLPYPQPVRATENSPPIYRWLKAFAIDKSLQGRKKIRHRMYKPGHLANRPGSPGEWALVGRQGPVLPPVAVWIAALWGRSVCSHPGRRPFSVFASNLPLFIFLRITTNSPSTCSDFILFAWRNFELKRLSGFILHPAAFCVTQFSTFILHPSNQFKPIQTRRTPAACVPAPPAR